MATINTVAPGTPITSAWGNSVASELNAQCLKKSGGTMTGTLIVSAAPAVILRRAGDTPSMQFETTGGSDLAHIIAAATGTLTYECDVAGAFHAWNVNGVQLARLEPPGKLILQDGLVVTGAVDMSGFNITARAGIFARNDAANQIIVADYSSSTAGIAAHAFISFYPDAVSDSSFGTRGGYVGFNGEGLQLQASTGGLVLQSVSGDITVEYGSKAAIFDASGPMLLGKSATGEGFTGTEVWDHGEVISTVATVNLPNLLCNRTGAANATGQKFVSFHLSGAEKGSISWDGTNVKYNQTSDYRLKNDIGPITGAVERLGLLKPRRITWKDDPAGVEQDGFLAHEVTPAVPEATSGDKDAVTGPPPDGEPAELYPPAGEIVPQQLDKSALVPLLVAAVQELAARVATLEGAAA
jgi:Chaperone of endosialidase